VAFPPCPRPLARVLSGGPALQQPALPKALLRLALLPLALLAAAPELVWSAPRPAPLAVPQLAGKRLAAAGSAPVVRVLLLQEGTLELAAAALPLRLGDGNGRTLVELPAGESLRLRTIDAGLELDTPGAASAAGAAGADARRTLSRQELWLEPVANRRGDGQFLLQGRLYRGRLRLRPVEGGLQAINHVDVESYLTSVVGSEMPASWPQAALRAQAVAARTYALSQRKPAAPFDLKASVASQVYRGVVAETASTREAVDRTRRQVLMHGQGLINAVFHSSSGGITENSGDLWTRQLPYLVSVPDFDESSPVARWEKRFDAEQLQRAFPETGGATAIEVLASSASGRVRKARIRGSLGEIELTGPQLRQRLDLRSTLVRFQFQAPELASLSPLGERLPPPPPPPGLPGLPGLPGASAEPLEPLRVPGPSLLVVGRGFGHGVGLSQWGAYGLALRGKGHEQILRHYYRGAELRLYEGTP
jgi:stage II sporulation protein D